MKPGIYHDLDFDDYLEIDAVSNTSLGAMKQSPLHYHSRTTLEKTKPLVLGSLTHCGKLEPLAIAKRYAVMPDFHLHEDNRTQKGERTESKNTTYVKTQAAAFRTFHQDKEIVPLGWYEEMVSLVQSVANNPTACFALNCVHQELSLVWEDVEFGILCKARLDAVTPGSHIADLKTCAELAKFPRSIATFGYHRQMAHYQEGWHALTGETLPTWIVPVEKAPPFCCQAAPMGGEAISEGRSERRDLIRQIVECTEAGEWPGPESPQEWTLPAWALNQEPVSLTVGGQKVSL